MRVTNSMLVSNFMNNLNTNMTKLDKLQNQIASGKKYAHISDNPIAVIYSREARYKLGRLEQYQANVQKASDWLKQVESSTMELNETIKNAYESLVQAKTDVMTDEDRDNVAEYMAQMRDHLLSTLNASYGDKYVFGGYNTTGNSESGQITGPFTTENGELIYNNCNLNDDSAANLNLMGKLQKDVLTFTVGSSIDMQATINGIDLAMFQTKDAAGTDVTLNMYTLLDDITTALRDGVPMDELEPYIAQLQDAQNHLMTKTAEIGGRTSRLDLLEARYEQDYLNYSQMLSDAEDADIAEVIMNQKMAEAVYNAALASGSQIIQPTLMDFLR